MEQLPACTVIIIINIFYMVIIIQTCVGHMVFWAVNELKEWQCPKWIATVNKWLNHVEYKIIVAVQSLSHVQLFCDPMDCSPPGSSVSGISQARILEWAATSSPGDLPDPEIDQSLLRGRWTLYH